MGRGKGGGDISIRRRAKAPKWSADHRGFVLGISPPPPEHKGTNGTIDDDDGNDKHDENDEDDEDDDIDDKPPLGGSSN